ncbi:hypothetical protein [Geothrix edaphica]|uniref:Site-specific integrase n=1 Tax=Geothrix edaphica TaxID=2927976 RepID=A0ABQ5Q134_9BACT|nr:hypothetical protein [Geothrix edaphica]GLH68233.1 hypothetical protein GETHED_25970 [Geothrix edaphica]
MSIDPHLTESAKRLQAYIIEGRRLVMAAFGIDFDSDIWQLPSKREAGRMDRRHDFSRFEEPFKSLLKAVVANESAPKNGRSGFSCKNFTVSARHFSRVVAGVKDLTTISADHFHQAVEDLRNRDDLTDVTKFNNGKELASLANALNLNRLTKGLITFRNPFSLPESNGDEHMIPPGAIKGFGAIWQEIMKGTDNDQDRLLACTATMLLCTGFRINELLSMPVDCWHPRTGRDSQGRILEGVFLGYVPEKNGLSEATQPKWIPSDLIPLMKECLDEIRRITDPFRENARALYEGRVNLPGLENDRAYTAAEAAELLGVTAQSTGRILGKSGTYPMVLREGRGGMRYALNTPDIRELVRSRSFLGKVVMEPWPQELHESLFVISSGFFMGSRNGLNGTADRLKAMKINHFLAGGTNVKSCFERFDKRDPDSGKFWGFSTHDPRHTLTTWMKRAGLSELEIAGYFNRSSRNPAVANRNYDHMQPWEMLEVVRQALERGEFIGPWADILKNIKDPIRRAELKGTMLGNISYSRLGLCSHAEGTTPPTMPEACARCTGLIVIKGNAGHIKETKEQLAECDETIARYQKQTEAGYFNKDRWLNVEMERREGLVRMLDIHLDPKIPSGYLVQLSPYRKREKAC